MELAPSLTLPPLGSVLPGSRRSVYYSLVRWCQLHYSGFHEVDHSSTWLPAPGRALCRQDWDRKWAMSSADFASTFDDGRLLSRHLRQR